MRASLVLVLFASMTAACSTSERPGLLRDDGGTVYFDGFIGPQDVVDVPGAEGGRADGTTPTGDQPGVDVPPGTDAPVVTTDQPGVDVGPGADVIPGVDTGMPPRDGAVGPDAGGPTDGGGPSADMGAGSDAGPDAMSPSDSGADAGERCTPGVTRQCMWGYPLAVIGVGPCRRGTQTCAPEGTWGMCVGQTEPDMESCNGEDDDCDGVVDNLIRSCGVGACQRMMLACVLGREVTCVQGMPSTEVCNNIDDDCDGMVDEDLTRSCFSAPTSYLDAGVCHSGTQRCSMGLWSACMGEVYPQVEVCNGMDDDCDGVVDNMCRDR